MTVEERVLRALEGLGSDRAYHYRRVMTATGIWRVMNPMHPQAKGAQQTSLATVSSTLHRLVREGAVIRVEGFGPRRGYGYMLRHWDA